MSLYELLETKAAAFTLAAIESREAGNVADARLLKKLSTWTAEAARLLPVSTVEGAR